VRAADSSLRLLFVSEAELVEALRTGDERAFMSLVAEYRASMLRVAQIYVPSRAVAEEVVQEAWVGVLTGLERFEGRSSLKTWIFRILTNIAKTRGERERRTLPLSALADPSRVPEPAVEPRRFLAPDDASWPGHWASPPGSWSAIPDERLLADETRAVISDAIEQLPPSQRAVITLRDVQGWSADEVCNALAVSETNQRVLLHRARSKVRRALEAYLGDETG
jgi:RNA polymerase sigma-70 factor, ECF subfamily